MVETVKAYWNTSIDVTCPKCQNKYDLLHFVNYWEFLAAKQNSKPIKNYETCCPVCKHVFKFDVVC